MVKFKHLNGFISYQQTKDRFYKIFQLHTKTVVEKPKEHGTFIYNPLTRGAMPNISNTRENLFLNIKLNKELTSSLPALKEYMHAKDKVTKKPLKPRSPKWEIPASILQLDENNFKQEISSKDLTLVMFYAPWCTHCHEMFSEFTKAAEDLEKDKKNVRMAIINIMASMSLIEEYNINAVPVIKLFRSGSTLEDFEGLRNAEEFKKFVLKYI